MLRMLGRALHSTTARPPILWPVHRAGECRQSAHDARPLPIRPRRSGGSCVRATGTTGFERRPPLTAESESSRSFVLRILDMWAATGDNPGGDSGPERECEEPSAPVDNAGCCFKMPATWPLSRAVSSLFVPVA